jgi:hypothetical protein
MLSTAARNLGCIEPRLNAMHRYLVLKTIAIRASLAKKGQ